MKKIHILWLALLAGVSADAQYIKLPAGKKFGVTMVTQMKTKASAMGQEMEFGTEFTNSYETEVKTVTDHGFTLLNTLKRIKVKTAVMGEENEVDSDDSSSRNDPQFESAFDQVNKPYEIDIENGKTTIKGEAVDKLSGMSGVPGIANDQVKFILSNAELMRLKEGNQWKDSSIAEGSRIVYNYTVLKTNETITELLITADMKIDMTDKQMGMDVKQSLKGTVNGRRQYNTVTGLLIKENTDVTINGTMETLGQTSPINITGKIITTID
ncbi:MAG: hypothetical protein V4557_12935 [Bacteroidota bacterium]